MRETGGKLTIHTYNETIGNTFDQSQYLGNEQMSEGLYICLKVIDTGIGMDAETIGRIFDPYFTTKETGHGLGLSATLGIIRTHGGGLFVDSTPHIGTTFHIMLPVHFED